MPLIIDSDMAPDDWTAILYMVKRNDVTIKAITVSGTGEVHGVKGARNCLRLLKMVNYEEIPVAYGSPKPLSGNHHFPLLLRFAVDHMLFLKLPKSKRKPQKLPAPDLIRQIILQSSEDITILAIGPLTNLADLFVQYPEIKGKISKIYIMGGAIDVAGNIANVDYTIDNPHAEWNIYCDPHAASIVFQSGIPTVLIPLDATNGIPIDREFVRKAKENRNNEISNFVYKILRRFGSHIDSGGVALWDAIAASIVENEEIAHFEIRMIKVVEVEGQESGRTKEDLQKGVKIKICKHVDKKKFESQFFNTILK